MGKYSSRTAEGGGLEDWRERWGRVIWDWIKDGGRRKVESMGRVGKRRGILEVCCREEP